MKKNEMSLIRIGALLMAVLMIVTYMPLLTENSAYAEGKEEAAEKVVRLSDAEVKANKARALAELKDELGIMDEQEADPEEKEPAEVKAADDKDTAGIDIKGKAPVLNSKVSAAKLNAGGPNGIIKNVTKPNSKGRVRITGIDISNPDYVYSGIWVADDTPEHDPEVQFTRIASLYDTTLNRQINMKEFSVGYHSIAVSVYNISTDEEMLVDYVDYVPTYIYKKASNSINWYQTGIKYIAAYYGKSTYYDSGYHTENLKVYMDFKRKGGKWSKKIYGPLSTSSSSMKKRTKLKPKSTYYVRMILGKKFKYNGKSYVFSGRQTGKASAKKKMMTAYKKPRIKKISIKGKRIVHTYRTLYAWRIRYIKSTGRIISRTPLYHTYRYYYTNYNVSVYFKKKQNIAGVQIKTGDGTIQKGGNKKKYTAKYSVSGNKKGKKIRVKVRCFRSKKYGGFSGWKSKRVKIR